MNNEIRNSVKIILINDRKELLLLSTDDEKIKNLDGNYNGRFWQLVGGKIEKGEKIFQAAKRELFEETGLKECDVEFYPNVVWEGILKLNMHGIETTINQKFIVAKAINNNISLKNLINEEKESIKSFKWFSLNEIKHSSDIIYPIDLPEYLPDILNGKFSERTISLDLNKQPNQL